MRSFPDLNADAPAARLGAALVRHARDAVPPNIALMRLVMESEQPADIDRAIAAALELSQGEREDKHAAHVRRVALLWESTPGAFDTVKRIVATVDHGNRTTAVAQWRSMFDRAADVSPEASAALYSLGRADLLCAATDEVIEKIRRWGILTRNQSILEIGCGIGRFVPALAADAVLTVGIDISRSALAVARRRCPAENVLLVCSTGRDLALFRQAAFDLVIAVDVFPYLVQSGLAAAHVAGAARVLRPGGRLLILNYSYRGDAKRDARDVARLARASRFAVTRNGTRDFALWDGVTFLLERAS